MDRLTRVIDLHNALPLATAGIEIEAPESYAYGYAVDILSAYEDTGLTPNQVEQMKQENAELKRLLKLAAKELTPDICDYCIYNGSKHCEEENAELECGNMACQFAYWRHYDEVKGLIKNGNELDSGV